MLAIHWFDSLDSTHLYLIESLKKGSLVAPCGVGATEQNNGVGSRGNSWHGEKGNFFFSFCVKEKHLPKDLPLASVSIYFSVIVKLLLEARGSRVWLKWPNDFYLKDKKIGGMITSKISESIICSIGLNLAATPDGYSTLDVFIEPYEFAESLYEKAMCTMSWKQVFSIYKIEFDRNRNFSFHLDGKLVSLRDAVLCDDGSIELENKKVYSLR